MEDEYISETNGFSAAISNVEDHTQYGPILAGPGAKREKRSYRLPHLTHRQKEAIQEAKNYAMEQGIKTVLLKQTITHHQQQQVNLQVSAQRQQAYGLMCRIYIGTINFEIREETIRQAFAPFGPIRMLSMPLDPVSRRHKGFAFLEYETPEAASISVDQMNGVVIGGFSIKVGRPSNMPQAQPYIEQIIEESKMYNRIYVASIHPELTENDIKSVFEAFGRMTFCKLAVEPMRPSRHKGYGYIEYETLQSTMDAVSAMNLFDLGGMHLRVGRAVTPPNVTLLPSTTGSLPTASAIAAAAVTAKITALEAVAKPPKIGPEIIDVAPLPPPGVAIPNISTLPPTSTLASNTLGNIPTMITPSVRNNQPNQSLPPPQLVAPTGLGNAPVLSVQPRPAYIPPSILNAQKQSKENGKGALELPDLTTLQQQEDMKIKGHQARHLVMQKLLRKNESCIMILKNMVLAEDVDEELEHEITDECSKYGNVQQVIIYQERQGEEIYAPVIVKLFVKFSTPEEAEYAVTCLNGRFYAGRTVTASTYDQTLFDENDLSA